MYMNCMKYKKKSSKTLRIANTNKGKLVLLPKCAVCCSKRQSFIKDQEARGLLSNLGIKTRLNKIQRLEYILF